MSHTPTNSILSQIAQEAKVQCVSYKFGLHSEASDCFFVHTSQKNVNLELNFLESRKEWYSTLLTQNVKVVVFVDLDNSRRVIERLRGFVNETTNLHVIGFTKPTHYPGPVVEATLPSWVTIFPALSVANNSADIALSVYATKLHIILPTHVLFYLVSADSFVVELYEQLRFTRTTIVINSYRWSLPLALIYSYYLDNSTWSESAQLIKKWIPNNLDDPLAILSCFFIPYPPVSEFMCTHLTEVARLLLTLEIRETGSNALAHLPKNTIPLHILELLI